MSGAPLHKAVNLLICCLHFLDRETKDRLMSYLCNHRLDVALYRMISEGLFPDWFREEFCNFDHLYATLGGLRYALTRAVVRDRTLEFVVGVGERGAGRYRFLMSEEECARRLAELNIVTEQARQWAQTLQQYLLERENKQ